MLFSGGKDSCYALHLAQRMGHEIACLLTVESENPESYMFHTPNIGRTRMQAQAMDIPLLTRMTEGEKEVELEDLRALIAQAKGELGIGGVVTGVIESVYQATRVQQICADLGLWVFNPLWKTDQPAYLHALVREGFEVLIVGVFAEPLERDWLGRKIDAAAIKELELLSQEYGIQPSGEGGEFETFVLSAPGWKTRLEIEESATVYEKNAGVLRIDQLRVVER